KGLRSGGDTPSKYIKQLEARRTGYTLCIQLNSHYRKSSGVSRIRLICKACRSISDKV
ncbi:MAG: hypothetical protein BECKG1743D_GA0114223_104003, partial [Candidatus Kentron sp. G]